MSANLIVAMKSEFTRFYQRSANQLLAEQAYAYLIIPHESMLTKDAQKRLKVLMEHSDLGSGFQIAMNETNQQITQAKSHILLTRDASQEDFIVSP